jgi:hypothetical protein
MQQLAYPLQMPCLLLRPLLPADRDAVHHLYSDWAVAKWLSPLAWPFTPASAATLSGAVADLQRGAGLFLALTHRTTGAFVGTISLRSTWIRGPTIRNWESSATPLGLNTRATASPPKPPTGRWSSRSRTCILCLRATVLRDNIASRRVLERVQIDPRDGSVGVIDWGTVASARSCSTSLLRHKAHGERASRSQRTMGELLRRRPCTTGSTRGAAALRSLDVGAVGEVLRVPIAKWRATGGPAARRQ